MNIPQDPIILLSFVNMKLRDEYSSLEALCEDLAVDQEELLAKLKAVGFEYDPEHNRFY